MRIFIDRFKFFLFFLFKVKITFKLPKKYKLICFDFESNKNTKILLKRYKYFVLKTRLEHFDEIYLNIKIIKCFFKYYEGSIKRAYLSAIIYFIEPKLILTLIDNSIIFSELAKVFYPRINFAAIQNGRRFDVIKIRKKLFIPNFFCLGNFDAFIYKKYKIKVNNFYPYGSLSLSNFIIKNKNFLIKKKFLYDICFIADVLINDIEREVGVKNTDTNELKLAKYIVRYCIKNKLKLVVLYKGENNKKNLFILKKFIKKNFSDLEYSFFIKSLEKNIYSNIKNYNTYNSYKTIYSSRVLCSSFTTMLLEKIALKEKILACNFTASKIFDFPNKGICSLKRCSFSFFEKRLTKVYNLTDTNYFKQIKKKRNYSIFFNKKYSTIKLIQDKIDKFLLI